MTALVLIGVAGAAIGFAAYLIRQRRQERAALRAWYERGGAGR